jgi:uncharacterized protein YdcH (DUF465 family)
MKSCIKCGKEITHHHQYCDKCYPQKTATINQLKKDNLQLKKEITFLKWKISKMKDNSSDAQKKEFLNLKKINQELRDKISTLYREQQ